MGDLEIFTDWSSSASATGYRLGVVAGFARLDPAGPVAELTVGARDYDRWDALVGVESRFRRRAALVGVGVHCHQG